mmetsp:Transcript_43994/g.125464  ORF Transcript_43994/g.125464 Transcript_43994/m.125464 type:complete len:294 (+) Transcript_43994:3034-3915(+)
MHHQLQDGASGEAYEAVVRDEARRAVRGRRQGRGREGHVRVCPVAQLPRQAEVPRQRQAGGRRRAQGEGAGVQQSRPGRADRRGRPEVGDGGPARYHEGAEGGDELQVPEQPKAEVEQSQHELHRDLEAPRQASHCLTENVDGAGLDLGCGQHQAGYEGKPQDNANLQDELQEREQHQQGSAEHNGAALPDGVDGKAHLPTVGLVEVGQPEEAHRQGNHAEARLHIGCQTNSLHVNRRQERAEARRQARGEAQGLEVDQKEDPKCDKHEAGQRQERPCEEPHASPEHQHPQDA